MYRSREVSANEGWDFPKETPRFLRRGRAEGNNQPGIHKGFGVGQPFFFDLMVLEASGVKKHDSHPTPMSQ